MGILDNLLNNIIKTDLDERLISEVKERVNEELSINGGVWRESFRLIGKIAEEAKGKPKHYYASIDGASYKTGGFNDTILGNNINVIYRITNFKDESYYKLGINNLPNFPNGFDFKHKKLSLDIVSIGGNVDQRTYADTIQHELEHLFQETKRDKSFTDDDLYKMALFLKNNFHDDPAAYMVGDLIYFSRQCENDAYVNGLYALLSDNYRNYHYPTANVIHGSPVYKGIVNMRANKKWLEDNKDDQQVKELFAAMNSQVHITPEKLLVFVDKSEKYLMNRIGKIIVKAQKDCNVPNDLEPTWWK